MGGLKGFHCINKNGTAEERQIYLEVRDHWLDAIANRVVGSVTGQPEMVEKIKGMEQELEQGMEQGMEQGTEQGTEQGMEQRMEQRMEQGREQGMEQERTVE